MVIMLLKLFQNGEVCFLSAVDPWVTEHTGDKHKAYYNAYRREMDIGKMGDSAL